MSVLRQEKVGSLIAATAGHASDFYRAHWGSARSFTQLPPMSRDLLRAVPLSRRRYKETGGIVKIVRDAKGSFLSEWGFEDIRRELFAIETARPFVYLTDPHETLEKALWCELHGMPGFAAERDPDVAITAAAAFQADSLITDTQAFSRIRALLVARSIRLRALTVLGDASDFTDAGEYAKYAEQVRFVLTLPETGVIATSSPANFPHFTSSDCIVEAGQEPLVTKLSMLVTPIIRYRFDGGQLTFA